MSVKVTRDRVAEVLATIRKLTSVDVLVGVPAERAERQPEPDEDGEPITNAQLGYIMETGAPETNIPARPFLVPGVENVIDQAIPRLKKAGEMALSGDYSQVEPQLTAIGLMAVTSVQQKMVDGPFAPLKPLTIANRLAKGRTGTKPLIDTGALRQSITFVIAKKGK